MHNSTNRPIRIYLPLLILLLLPSAFAGIGIDNLSDPAYKRLYNNDANYWLDIIGFQISNTPSSHQANMEMCFEAKCGIFTIPKRCADTLAWSWFDDNTSEYARTTAYTTIGNVDLNILYALDSPDQNNILIQPLIRNRTGLSCDLNLFYVQEDLNIALDKNGDWLQLWKNGEKNYDLNGLDNSWGALDVNRFRIFDIPTQSDMVLWFNSVYTRTVGIFDTNYIAQHIVIAQPQAPQLFSPVSLKTPLGTVASGTTAKFNLWWKDVRVPTGVRLDFPDSNSTYDWNTNIEVGCFVLSAGAPPAASYVGSLQDCNNSTCSILQNMTTNNADMNFTIIQGDANPISTTMANVDLNWTLTSKLNVADTRYIRCKVDSNNAAGCRAAAPCYSTIRSIASQAPSLNKPVDVNIVKPNGGEVIGVRDGNYRIDFNVSDKDCNGIFYCKGRLDANIDYNVSGGWTRIVTDLNLLATASAGSNKGIYCDDLNFAGGDINKQVTCHYDWNLAVWREPSVDSKIDVNVTDNNGSTDTNRSANEFRLHNWLISDSLGATSHGSSMKLVRSIDKSRIFLVYEDGSLKDSNIDVWFVQSDNNGLTWSNPLDISDAAVNSANPSIDINSTGGLHVVWRGTPSANNEILYKSCSADCNVLSSWSADVNISNNLGNSRTAMFDINSTDGINVAWEDNSGGGVNFDILYSSCQKNCGNEANWSSDLNISNNLPVSVNPTMDINSTGGIHIAWSEGTPRDIRYSSCPKDCSNSSNWSGIFSVVANIGASDDSVIVISNEDKIHLVWEDDTSVPSFSVRYKNCSSNCNVAASWGNDFNVNDANGVRPTIAFDSDNNVYVVWADDNVGITANRGNINTRKRQSNGTWDVNVIKTTDGNKNTYPNAAKTLLAGAPYDYLQYVYTRGLVADYNIVFGHEQAVALPAPFVNSLVDINIVRPNGGEIIGVRDGNYRIDFNVHDSDCNGIFSCSQRLDANIELRSKTGAIKVIAIITDLNLLATATAGSNKGIYCDDLNFAGSKDANKEVTCHYDWNLAVWRESSDDFRIDVNVTDNNGSTDTNRSADRFRLHNWLISDSDTATAFNNARKLARNSDGNRIYLVYEANPPTSSSTEVWFVQSDNNGSTWSTPVNVSNDANISLNPAIDINSTGGLNLIWYERLSAAIRGIKYSSCSGDCNSGSNWGPAITLANIGALISVPAIDINSTGGINVVFDTIYNLGSNQEILYKSCSRDCGNVSNWSNDVNVSSNSGDSVRPSIDINSTGGINVVWHDNTPGNNEILYKSCSGDCGIAGNWSADVNLSINLGNSRAPIIAISSDNKVHVAWYDNNFTSSLNVIYKNCSSNCNASASWGNDFNVNDANGEYPTIAFDSDNNVYVVWMDDNTSNNLYHINTRKRQSSGTWDANIIKTTDGNNAYPNARKSTVSGTSDYWDYVYTKGVVADYNIMFITEVLKTPSGAPPPANNAPDANIVKVDNNAVSGAMATFNYYVDGNLTIDFNAFDLDVNGINRLDVNLDYRRIDTNASTRIITDLNLMVSGRCDDINFTNTTKCSWDWNIINIADANYTIDINITDLNATTIKYEDFNFKLQNRVPNNLPDANITKIDNNLTSGAFYKFNYYVDGNLTIDFNAFDLDVNGTNRLDVNIDYRKVDTNASTRIITDLNLMAAGRCDDANFANSTKCAWDWNIVSLTNADGNYTLDINITDLNATTIKYGDFNFRIENRVKNNAPDANVVKIDGNLVSGALAPIFDYYIDGNFTIDFNVSDKDWNGNFWGHGRIDVNIDARKVDTNVSTRIITDLNITRAGYCDDQNFSGAGMNATGTTCHWDWNAVSIADGNYTIDVNVTDANSTTRKYGDFNFKVQNVAPPIPNNVPDANITKVDSNLTSGAMAPQFNYYVDGNFTIDFNVHDLDWNGNFWGHGRIDVNIDARRIDTNASSRIITDLNITNPLHCDDQNFAGGDINKTGAACHWDWNAISAADGNYTLDINISDGNATALKYGDFNFYVKNVAPPAPPAAEACRWWKGGVRCLWEWIWKEEGGG